MSKGAKPSARRRRTNGRALADLERVAGRIVAASAERCPDGVALSLTAVRGGLRETDLCCMSPLEALSLASVLQMAVAKGITP